MNPLISRFILAPGEIKKNEKINLESIGYYKLANFNVKNNNNQTLATIGVRLASRADYNVMDPELTRGLKDRLSAALMNDDLTLDYHWAENYDVSKDQKVAVGLIVNLKGDNLRDSTLDVIAGALTQE